MAESTGIDVRDLIVRFGAVTALEGVSVDLTGTGVCGLIGTNGAGKTTLIHTVLGFLTPTAGSVTVTGDPQSIAYCPDTPSFEPHLSAREVLQESAALGRARRPGARPAFIDECLAEVGLTDVSHRRVQGFSRGMRQRLGIAAATVRDPRILILDEPTSSLDPVGRDQILGLIAELGRRLLVVFSSHILDDVDRVSDSLVALHRGRPMYVGPRAGFAPGDLAGIHVRTVAPATRLARELARQGLTVQLGTGQEAGAWVEDRALPVVLEHFARHPGSLLSISRPEGTLHQEFIARLPPEGGPS